MLSKAVTESEIYEVWKLGWETESDGLHRENVRTAVAPAIPVGIVATDAEYLQV